MSGRRGSGRRCQLCTQEQASIGFMTANVGSETAFEGTTKSGVSISSIEKWNLDEEIARQHKLGSIPSFVGKCLT
jgi:hypothetical protein